MGRKILSVIMTIGVSIVLILFLYLVVEAVHSNPQEKDGYHDNFCKKKNLEPQSPKCYDRFEKEEMEPFLTERFYIYVSIGIVLILLSAIGGPAWIYFSLLIAGFWYVILGASKGWSVVSYAQRALFIGIALLVSIFVGYYRLHLKR